MKKHIIKHYYIDTFETDIVLIQCKYEKLSYHAKKVLPMELQYIFNKNNLDSYDPTIKAQQYPFDGGGSLIWVNENANIGVLVHEIVHAVFHLCNRKGIKYHSESEEIYAYLMESIFNNLIK